jgi:hypothetical protein
LPSGERDLLEIFGRADIDIRVVPRQLEHGVLIALAVDDVATAREELAAAGVELIGDLVWATDITGSAADDGWAGASSRRRTGKSTCCSRTASVAAGDPASVTTQHLGHRLPPAGAI